jgi:two-component sensor histidine kinase
MIHSQIKNAILLAFALVFAGIPSQLRAQNPKIDSLLNALEILPEDTNKVFTYFSLSNKFKKMDYKKGAKYADSGLMLSRKLEFSKGVGRGYMKIGSAYLYVSSYDTAIDNYLKALDVYRSYNDTYNEAKALNNLGLANMNMGGYEEAVVYYTQSLELKRENKDTLGVGIGYGNLAIVFAIKGDYEVAAKYFNNALDIYQELGNEKMIHYTLLDLGGLYKDLGKYEKSIEHVKKAQEYYLKTNGTSQFARSKYIMGCNYEELGKYKLALVEFKEAMAIYLDMGSKRRIAGCRLKISGMHFHMKQYALSLEMAKEALAMAQENNTAGLIIRSYKQISDIYYHTKKYELAYDYRVKYDLLKDSIHSIEGENKILELEAKYENKLQKNQINDLEASNTIQELKIQEQRNQKIILIGLVVFILIVSSLVYNQYRVKKNNNELLKEKNSLIMASLEEKEVLLREIHHRVKNNLQFVWSLLNLQTRHVKDKQTLETLNEGKNRVKTMALIHQKLYQADNLKGIDIGQYIDNLTKNLFDTYHVDESKVKVLTDIDPMVLDIDTALPLGLIMNELITNSLKYAFKGVENGELEIKLKKQDQNLSLTVKDNGKGMTEKPDLDALETFGLRLVQSLAKQLKAKVDIDVTSGTAVNLDISKFELA